jgi:competence protein ComGC
MYSLIIVLVAIALAVLLALATLYYGSEAWFKNDTEAQVATVVNQAQQISAAYTLHHTEKNAIADSIPSLVELNYLKTVQNLSR